MVQLPPSWVSLHSQHPLNPCQQATCPRQSNPLYSRQSQPRERPQLGENTSQTHPKHICFRNLAGARRGTAAPRGWPGRPRSLLRMKMFQLPGKPFLGITEMYSTPLPSDPPLAPCLGENPEVGGTCRNQSAPFTGINPRESHSRPSSNHICPKRVKMGHRQSI